MQYLKPQSPNKSPIKNLENNEITEFSDDELSNYEDET